MVILSMFKFWILFSLSCFKITKHINESMLDDPLIKRSLKTCYFISSYFHLVFQYRGDYIEDPNFFPTRDYYDNALYPNPHKVGRSALGVHAGYLPSVQHSGWTNGGSEERLHKHRRDTSSSWSSRKTRTVWAIVAIVFILAIAAGVGVVIFLTSQSEWFSL